jgi:two-component system sensor histidine kinase KdpD
VLAIAVVTLAVELLDGYAPVLSLGALYVFAVLPIAAVWGLAYAIPVAIGSMLAFNFLFLPPLYTFTLADGQNWVALVVYLVSAVVVSELAVRARRRAAESEQREREASFLARVSATLLESVRVEDELRGIAIGVARVLGVDDVRIELDPPLAPESHEPAFDLAAGGRQVGRLFVERGARVDNAAAGRVLPGLASLLAAASDRERLAQRALEAETLRRSDAAKTAVLRSVSHDLRSPLTAMRAATEALVNPTLELSEEDEAGLLETMTTESKRLSRLVDDLLDLSRLEVGAASPLFELWTLDDLVGRTLTELGRAGEHVSVDLPEELPPVHVDGAQIERVLANLVENALKYSPENGTVDIRAALNDGELIVRVADRGPGLTEAELGRIFEPFEYGDAQVAQRGAGLGLAIARGFAQANGGILWAESRRGEGAVFVLSLPVALASVETPA